MASHVVRDIPGGRFSDLDVRRKLKTSAWEEREYGRRNREKRRLEVRTRAQVLMRSEVHNQFAARLSPSGPLKIVGRSAAQKICGHLRHLLQATTWGR